MKKKLKKLSLKKSRLIHKIIKVIDELSKTDSLIQKLSALENIGMPMLPKEFNGLKKSFKKYQKP
jgi:hypothetical protein